MKCCKLVGPQPPAHFPWKCKISYLGNGAINIWSTDHLGPLYDYDNQAWSPSFVLIRGLYWVCPFLGRSEFGGGLISGWQFLVSNKFYCKSWSFSPYLCSGVLGVKAGDDFSLLRQIIPKSVDAVIITLEVVFFKFFNQLKKTLFLSLTSYRWHFEIFSVLFHCE